MTEHQPPPQPHQPQRQEPPRKRRVWLWIGIVLGILWIAGWGAMIRAMGGEDPAATKAQPTPWPTCDLGGCDETRTPAAPPAEETTTEPEPTPESNCKPLKKSQLSEITTRMDSSTRVVSGVWVPLSEEYQFGFNQVIALRLTGGRVATFAVENLGKSDHGLLIAVNRPARNHFTWGAAVNPGSAIDNDLQAVKNSSEYAKAVDCTMGQE